VDYTGKFREVLEGLGEEEEVKPSAFFSSLLFK
jgi:hypothetical protein